MTRAGVDLIAGGAVTLDWQLDIANTEETIEVHAASPMVDVHTAAVPNRLTAGMLALLPTTRNVPALANLTPGVVAEVPFGASANSFTTSIDGTPGSRPTNGGNSVLPVYHAIEEMQVIASGATAEYGDFTGVQSVLVLRSGGNTLRGLGEYRTRHPNWVGNNRQSLPAHLQQRFTPTALVADWDLAGSVGGPLVRDRVWYFGGYEQIREDTRPASFMALPRTSEDPLISLRDARLIAKSTISVAPSLRVETFYQHNKQRNLNWDANPTYTPEVTSSWDIAQNVWNARLLWTPTSNLFVAVNHGGHIETVYDGPDSPDGPPGRFDRVTQNTTVNGSFFYESRTRPVSTAASVTGLVDGVAGVSHEFKLGVEHQHAASTERYGSPGGRFFF